MLLLSAICKVPVIDTGYHFIVQSDGDRNYKHNRVKMSNNVMLVVGMFCVNIFFLSHSDYDVCKALCY